MTTYLVTGATGFIGGNLAQRLLARAASWTKAGGDKR